MLTHLGFKIGDYVIADHAQYDDFSGRTFKITELTDNRRGDALIKVVDITTPDATGTSFYPSELSYEDGSRPNINVVNRGAW
jgi:nucleoside phosphorylase